MSDYATARKLDAGHKTMPTGRESVQLFNQVVITTCEMHNR